MSLLAVTVGSDPSAVVASVGAWRSLPWLLVSCCVVPAREWRSQMPTTRRW